MRREDKPHAHTHQPGWILIRFSAAAAPRFAGVQSITPRPTPHPHTHTRTRATPITPRQPNGNLLQSPTDSTNRFDQAVVPVRGGTYLRNFHFSYYLIDPNKTLINFSFPH